MKYLAELDGADPAGALERRLAAAGASPRQAGRILRDWIRGRGVGAASGVPGTMSPGSPSLR
jgi:hypothetical protein